MRSALFFRFAATRGALAALVLAGACASQASSATTPASILDRRLTDGRSVRDIARGSIPTALLVYTPGICYACGTPLPLWERASRQGSIKLVLVLTATPTKDEERQLVLERVPVTGILAPEKTDAQSTPGPSEYVIRSDSIVSRAVGMPQIRGRKLWSAWLPAAPKQ